MKKISLKKNISRIFFLKKLQKNVTKSTFAGMYKWKSAIAICFRIETALYNTVKAVSI